MARGAYVGINNVARKVRKMYVGVGGVARKVKKGYIGIGGVARLFYRSSIAARKISSSLTTWSDYSEWGSGASIGNYAVFAGYRNTLYDFGTTVLAYNNALTRSTPTTLSSGALALASTSTSTHAIFAGGYNAIVNAFNSSLTRTTISIWSRWEQGGMTTLSDRALLAGGHGNGTAYDTVYSLDTSLTRATLTALSAKRYGHYAASNSRYAVFAGGLNDTALNTVDAYNTSFTRTSAASLDMALYEWDGNTVGLGAGMENHALLFPRSTSTTYTGSVYSYDTSLTKSFAPVRQYSVNDYGAAPAAVTVNNAVLVGGLSIAAGNNGTNRTKVDLYDDSLTKTIADDFTYGRWRTAAAKAGDYAIFIGESDSNYPAQDKTIEVYEVS